MVSKRREVSETGFYHVMQRGVNQFDIFEDDEDRSFYCALLTQCAKRFGIAIHAWCLMDNHTHIVLHAKDHRLMSAMMRQLGSRYARYFNKRHKRIGHLFSDRFASVCIADDEQLIATVRYVHRNPMAHDQELPSPNFRWSSYHEYVAGEIDVADIAFVLDVSDGLDNFIASHRLEPVGRFLDTDTVGLLGDEKARALADRALLEAGLSVGVSDVGTLAREVRDKAIAVIKAKVGCSLRQLQRLTAIAYSAIRNAVMSCGFLSRDNGEGNPERGHRRAEPSENESATPGKRRDDRRSRADVDSAAACGEWAKAGRGDFEQPQGVAPVPSA